MAYVHVNVVIGFFERPVLVVNALGPLVFAWVTEDRIFLGAALETRLACLKHSQLSDASFLFAQMLTN
jgi:hypothetical protein